METTTNKKGKRVTVTGIRVTGDGFENVKAEIIKGMCIRISGSRTWDKWNKETKSRETVTETFDRVFNVGDTCIYDSYNFDYTNPIKSVGEKRVGFPGKSIELGYFIYKNWDYSPEKVMERRMSWSD